MPRRLRKDEAIYECRYCGKREIQVKHANQVIHGCRGPKGLDRPKTRSMKKVQDGQEG